jgi:hypothetical protein
MTRTVIVPALLALSSIGLACGDNHLGLDPNTPANELTEDEYRTLCDEAYSPLRDPGFVEDTCVHLSIGPDPARCEETLEACRAEGGLRNAEDIDALCRSSRSRDQFDCVATVGEYLDCIDRYNAVLARFLAGLDCSMTAWVEAPLPEDVPACEPVVSTCGPIYFLY